MNPELIVHTDASAYASDVRAFAESHEGENAVFLGLLEWVETAPPEAERFMAHVTHNGGIVHAALFTGQNMVVAGGGQGELQLVADRLKSLGIDIPGLVGPAAQCEFARSTAHGISVNAVYTPQAERRKGYATALVAAVSQEALRRGKRFCVLYTDLANPTSNSIYQKIGYTPLIDSRHYRFRY